MNNPKRQKLKFFDSNEECVEFLKSFKNFKTKSNFISHVNTCINLVNAQTNELNSNIYRLDGSTVGVNAESILSVGLGGVLTVSKPEIHEFKPPSCIDSSNYPKPVVSSKSKSSKSESCKCLDCSTLEAKVEPKVEPKVNFIDEFLNDDVLLINSKNHSLMPYVDPDDNIFDFKIKNIVEFSDVKYVEVEMVDGTRTKYIYVSDEELEKSSSKPNDNQKIFLNNKWYYDERWYNKDL